MMKNQYFRTLIGKILDPLDDAKQFTKLDLSDIYH